MKTRHLLATVVPLSLAATALVVAPSAAPPAVAASAPASGTLFTGSMGAKVFYAADNGTPLNVVDLATNGIYSPQVYGWAVVFDWTTIEVEAGAVVKFLNHPTGAPVIWHATGDVTIAGQVNLDGEFGHNWNEGNSYAQPGPGGSRGGRGAYYQADAWSAGFGPGGGGAPAGRGGNGSYATAGLVSGYGSPGELYGGAGVFPLVGGSGGAGGSSSAAAASGGGGAGGGAILIASDGALVVSSTGTVMCRGGAPGSGTGQYNNNSGGGGSGGAIRLVGDSLFIQGNAHIEAYGYNYGGSGRVRLEANAAFDPLKYEVSGLIAGSLSESPDHVYEIIPTAEPSLQITEVAHEGSASGIWTDVSALTSDPYGVISPSSSADVSIPHAGTIGLKIRAQNIAPGELVLVRVTPARGGQAVTYSSSPLVTVQGAETEAVVDVDMSGGVTAVQMRVDFND